MRMAVLLLALSLLLAGCVKSVSETPQKAIEKPTAISEETSEPLDNSTEEIVEQQPTTTEEVNETTVSVDDVLSTFAAGKMYYCKGTYATAEGNSSFESWLYYDVANKEKKVKYVGSSYVVGGAASSNEVIAINKADFDKGVMISTMYSKWTQDNPLVPEGCDYLKLESTTPLEYDTVSSYEESVSSEAQEGSFSAVGSGTAMTVDCNAMDYDPSIFEPQGEVCSPNIGAGVYG